MTRQPKVKPFQARPKGPLPLSYLIESEKGRMNPELALVKFFGTSSIDFYSKDAFDAIERSLRVFAAADPNKKWGRMQYGAGAWEVIEVKDKWDFLDKYITPIIEKCRPLAPLYDEVTREAFERCEAKIVALKNSTAPDRKRQPSPETLEKAKRAKELKEQGLTQKQIGEEMGVNRGRVSQLLNGDRDTCYNVTSVAIIDAPPRPKTRGNSKEYREALVDRDAPELAEKVRTGELSAHAAAKKLGKVRSHALNIGPKSDPVVIAQKMVDFNKDLAISIALEIQNLCTEEQP